MEKPHKQAYGPAISRLGDLMDHTNLYSCNGATRLARDIGVSDSTICRLMHGKINPSFILVERITAALEREFGHWIDPRDIFSEFGRYLTQHLCDVVGCMGCTPSFAYTSEDRIKPEYKGVRAGQWITSRYPNGYPYRTRKEANA